jgi:hypothetical protein
MSKQFYVLCILILLLSACGAPQSWEEEQVTEIKQPLLSDEVNVNWTLEDDQASTTGEKLIRLEIEKKNGERIDQFEINHEKLLHLIIISRDLSYFNHVHPEYKGNGEFEIGNVFPMGGDYRLIADFKPSNASAMTKMTWLKVEGDQVQPVPVVVDDNFVKVVDGKQVLLSIDKLAAKEEITMKFTITDAVTGEPITDLEPYLGAIGHVVILSEDGEKYVHVHAEEGQGSGPEASFETTLPRSGIYKIWGQFQRDHQVFTVSYVINVP